MFDRVSRGAQGGTMNWYLRAAAFVITAVAAVSVIFLVRQATAPVSTIIKQERNKFAASFDATRAETDAQYVRAFREKLHFLTYRYAAALNEENKPDSAIKALKTLIREEEERGEGAPARNSRSYINEANYYEVLAESYDLKEDENKANLARHERIKLLGKAAELRRKEYSGEGKSVRSGVD